MPCTANLILLGPDESHQFARGLDDDLAPGTYRFRISLSPESAPFRPVDEAFASMAFTVILGQPRPDSPSPWTR